MEVTRKEKQLLKDEISQNGKSLAPAGNIVTPLCLTGLIPPDHWIESEKANARKLLAYPMAVIIPSIASCQDRMTSGERRFANRLEQKLDDDYWIWYDVAIGKKQRHPDFILLHPRRGLLVLEVKDWKADTIQKASPKGFTILTNQEPKKVAHPLEQARQYVLEAVKLLERDAALIHPRSHAYAGKLAFPYGWGMVLTNISRKKLEQQLGPVIEPHLVICQDEMYESVDVEEFQKRLWDMFPYEFGQALSTQQIDRIRYHIFPEITIQPSLLPEEELPAPVTIADELIRVMDIQQEQLARSLGGGHRIIHGVAGSGKTMILAYRCELLAQQLRKPILVLCYNITLAAKLRTLLAAKGIWGDRVIVSHFHSWIFQELRSFNIPYPQRDGQSVEAYLSNTARKLLEYIEAGRIPAGRYGAVLIDEGHDFKPGWFKIAAWMVDPDTQSLLVLYDDAQKIYGNPQRPKFSFKSVGISAQGRTTILRLNYRNTAEILTVAYEFAREVMLPSAGEQDEDTPILVEPQSANRHGPQPEFYGFPDLAAEAYYVAERAVKLYEQGIAWNEMAVLYRTRRLGATFKQLLAEARVPVEWVDRDRQSKAYDPTASSIKLMTMHSSKGLEFPIVFVSGIGYMPLQKCDRADEAKLLYVAMTRAIQQLILTYDRWSEFVQQVQEAMRRGADLELFHHQNKCH